MSLKLGNIALLNTNGADDCYIIGEISKTEAKNLMKNIDLLKKAELYKT